MINKLHNSCWETCWKKPAWKIEVKEEEAKTAMDFTGTQCGDVTWNTMWTW
jgi:hypothetical protein